MLADAARREHELADSEEQSVRSAIRYTPSPKQTAEPSKRSACTRLIIRARREATMFPVINSVKEGRPSPRMSATRG